MARKSLDYLGCAIANALDELGDRWTLLILRDSFMGVRRFDEFVEDLGIARNILTDRLERLIAAGIIEARPYQDNPVRHDYRLTEQGKDLFDVMMSLWSYGERWNAPVHDGRRAIHNDCGHDAAAVAHCAHCGERLTRRNVRIEPPLPVVATRLTKAG